MGSKRFFTLIELMVVLSVFTVITGIAFTALKLNDTYRDTILTQIELYRKSKKIFDTIAKELSLSSSDKVNITDANPDILTFQVPLLELIDDNYNIPWGADNQEGYYIRYELNGDFLKRKILDTAYSVVSEGTIANHVTDLQFSLGTDSVIVNVTLSRTNEEGRIINFTSEFEVSLGNEW